MTSTRNRKTRPTIWQMPEFWLRLCGKVVGQQYNYIRTAQNKEA